MINNGHTVQISLYHTMHMIVPDGTRYIAQQMHFHWGDASSEISGSEHTIDGTRYVAEAHLVHYNSKYHSFEEAQNAPDGLAVLAFFLKIQEYSENLYYSSFISHLNSIKYPGQSTVIEGLNIMDMMPHNPQHYYTYTGSLTTPPCTQDISWFLLADAVLISITQARNLESTLQDHSNKTLQNNYRTTQPLHNRVVESNFKILFNQHSEYPVLNGIYNKLKTLRKLEKQKKEKGQEKKEKSSKERKSKVKHN
ncbi:carbonic anhydrase 6 isoform X2 [Erinaceus europaeus]|nr:carbonic anhydrase 6 isoform X2 [Erinaceus europaeus]